jgi:hypothetical protein
MIAIAIGLPGGLETTVASSGKKDGNTALFADTFQQASASGSVQATANVTHEVGRIDRNISQPRKTGASPAGETASEVATGAGGGLSTATVRNGDKALAGAGTATVAEGAREGIAAVAVTKSSVAAVPDKDQAGSGVAEESGTIETAEGAKAAVDLEAVAGVDAEEDKDHGLAPSADKNDDASVAVAGGKQPASAGASIKTEGSVPVGQKDAVISGASASLPKSINPVSVASLQQDSGQGLNAIDVAHENRVVFSANNQAIQKPAKAFLLAAAAAAPDVSSKTVQCGLPEGEPVSALSAALGVGISENETKPSQRRAATASPAAVPGVGTAHALSASDGLAAPAVRATVNELSGSAQLAAPGQATSSRPASQISKPAVHAQNAKPSGTTLNAADTIPAAAQSVSTPVAAPVASSSEVAGSTLEVHEIAAPAPQVQELEMRLRTLHPTVELWLVSQLPALENSQAMPPLCS